MSEYGFTEIVTEPELVSLLTSATSEVFTTMLGREIEPTEHLAAARPSSASGVVSLVGLAGQWAGTGSLSCSAALACRLSSSFLMTECESVDDDVLDAIAELTNMIIGNVKTSLEERLGPMGLSIPTVIFGRNFQTRSAGHQEWVVVPLRCCDEDEAEILKVQICLAPNREGTQRTLRAGLQIPHALGA